MTGSHGPRELSRVLVQEWKPVLLHLVPSWPRLWKEEDYHLASYLTEMELDRESRGLQDPCSGPTLQMHQGSRSSSVNCSTCSLGKGQAWRPQHIYSQSAAGSGAGCAEVTRFESGGAVNRKFVLFQRVFPWFLNYHSWHSAQVSLPDIPLRVAIHLNSDGDKGTSVYYSGVYKTLLVHPAVFSSLAFLILFVHKLC